MLNYDFMGLLNNYITNGKKPREYDWLGRNNIGRGGEMKQTRERRKVTEDERTKMIQIPLHFLRNRLNNPFFFFGSFSTTFPSSSLPPSAPLSLPEEVGVGVVAFRRNDNARKSDLELSD